VGNFDLDDITGTARLKIRVMASLCTVEDSGEVIAEFTVSSGQTLAIVAARGEMYSTANLSRQAVEECIQSLQLILNRPEVLSGPVMLTGSYTAEAQWENLPLSGYPASYKLKCTKSSLCETNEQGHSHSTALYRLVMGCFRMIKSMQ
jgi:hypothetical protein